MAIDPITVPMIGLPETGKTTFLAALWYVVKHHDEVSGALALDKLNGDILTPSVSLTDPLDRLQGPADMRDGISLTSRPRKCQSL